MESHKVHIERRDELGLDPNENKLVNKILLHPDEPSIRIGFE
jgi:hypothetical protein